MADIIPFPSPGYSLIAVDEAENGTHKVEVWDWPALANAGGRFPTMREALSHALDLSEQHGLPYLILCEFDDSVEVRHG
jgi:hypothetical protein